MDNFISQEQLEWANGIMDELKLGSLLIEEKRSPDNTEVWLKGSDENMVKIFIDDDKQYSVSVESQPDNVVQGVFDNFEDAFDLFLKVTFDIKISEALG